jgi:pseudouridine-5'-phosphate glycosidase/pseudouridine kinase
MPHIPPPPSVSATAREKAVPAKKEEPSTAGHIVDTQQPEVLVIGGVAVDVSCDYTPRTSSAPTPVLHTSNPSIITESLGGVANNVAYALHLSGIKTRLISSIGSDVSGAWVREKMQARGMDCRGLTVSSAHNTARYVAVNDGNGGLFVASADMTVIEKMDWDSIKDSLRAAAGVEWVVIDGNIVPETLVHILRHCRKAGIKGGLGCVVFGWARSKG